jgi:hypothetical protein
MRTNIYRQLVYTGSFFFFGGEDLRDRVAEEEANCLRQLVEERALFRLV